VRRANLGADTDPQPEEAGHTHDAGADESNAVAHPAGHEPDATD
jgi:hypothetical protein